MLDPTLRWNGAAWFAEAGGWITERLGERGVTVRTIERHRIRFWSAVLTVDTDRGRFWFKENHPASAREMPVTELIARVRPGVILVPVAVDPAAARILTADAGPTLAAAHGWNTALACDLVRVCAELQRALVGYRDELLAAGVPDLTPDRLPDLLEQQLAEAARTPAEHLLHLTAEQRAAARARLPQLRDDIEVLAGSGLPVTLDHNDLHLGNAFGPAAAGAARALRLFDFGDCLLAHPFAVLRVPLHKIVENGGTARDLDRMKDSYLDAWGLPAPRAEQLRWLDAAVRISGIGRWEVWRRLARDVPAPVIEPYRRYLAHLLPRLGDRVQDLPNP